MLYRLTFEMHSDFVLALKRAANNKREIESALRKRVTRIQEHMIKHGSPPPDTAPLPGNLFVHTFTLGHPRKRRTLWWQVCKFFLGRGVAEEDAIYYVSFEYDRAQGRVRFADVGLYVDLLVASLR